MSKQAKSSFKVGRGKGKLLLGIVDPDIADEDVVLALVGETRSKSDFKVGKAKSAFRVGRAKAVIST